MGQPSGTWPREVGKCPGLWDGRELSAGVRVDPEAPGSMARVHVGSRVSGTRGNVETVAPWPPAADGGQPSASGSRVGTLARKGWGKWNVVENNAALSATAIQLKPACRRPKGCARGGRPEDPSTGD